jgi:hypothetical protein
VAVERLIDQTGSSTYPMELWIDDKDLVRRVLIAYDFQVPGQGQDADFSMRMEFFDYGTAIDVAPPPDSEVMDLADLARSLPQGGGGQQPPGGGQQPPGGPGQPQPALPQPQ